MINHEDHEYGQCATLHVPIGGASIKQRQREHCLSKGEEVLGFLRRLGFFKAARASVLPCVAGFAISTVGQYRAGLQ
ncbi:hypothetical protein ACE6H2_003117 [Prunus campanulata]